MDGRTIALLIDSFWQILLPGLTVTIPLTAISFLFGLIIALFTALVQIAHVRVLDQLARFYVWVIRGTPLLVQLFVIFYGLPSLGVTLDAFPSAIIVFSINTGAYAAEYHPPAAQSQAQQVDLAESGSPAEEILSRVSLSPLWDETKADV